MKSKEFLKKLKTKEEVPTRNEGYDVFVNFIASEKGKEWYEASQAESLLCLARHRKGVVAVKVESFHIPTFERLPRENILRVTILPKFWNYFCKWLESQPASVVLLFNTFMVDILNEFYRAIESHTQTHKENSNEILSRTLPSSPRSVVDDNSDIDHPTIF